MIPEISLDTHWRCEYADRAPDGRIDGFDVSPLASFQPLRIGAKMAWLEREFDLPPIEDECIGYSLTIDSAPMGTHLTLNGRELGEIAAPLALDVTDTVFLEGNRLILRVPRGSAGAVGSVRLIAIPCDS